MGYSKKLYNVLGVTSSIIAYPLWVYNAKDSQILQFLICVFVQYLQILTPLLRRGPRAADIFHQKVPRTRPCRSSLSPAKAPRTYAERCSAPQ